MMAFGDSGRVIYGVDFSGAKDAGKRIWIARGLITDDVLMITACFEAQDLPGSGRDRERSLKALREFLSEQKQGIFGLDFPFGLPRALVKEESWEEFIVSFEDTYRGPDEFRGVCMSGSGGRELKRWTDFEQETPFSPYNLRLYRQTYYGIRDVLGPLIGNNAVCVLPMQRPLSGRAWVVEICPSSTLKREHLSLPYKGRDKKRRAARERILEGIQRRGVLITKEARLRLKILDNPGGDAIDSVVAAFTTFRALRNGFGFCNEAPYTVEGRVYA